jgi:hypothetical protein
MMQKIIECILDLLEAVLIIPSIPWRVVRYFKKHSADQ